MSDHEVEGTDQSAPAPLLRAFAAETAVDAAGAARALARARAQRPARPPSWGCGAVWCIVSRSSLARYFM